MQNKKKAADLEGNLLDLVCMREEVLSPLTPFGIFCPIQKFPSLSIYTITQDMNLCGQIRMNCRGKN